jgi:hypothetical protein
MKKAKGMGDAIPMQKKLAMGMKADTGQSTKKVQNFAKGGHAKPGAVKGMPKC